MAIAIAGYPYSAKAALLDLGDNSLESGAAAIGFFIKETGPFDDAFVVADTGSGIADEVLDEVLRPGSYTSQYYSKNSLSRYGIGLKGAGFSLGRRITVLTRTTGGELKRRSIDMDMITELDKWVQDGREPAAADRKNFDWAMAQLTSGGQDTSTSGTVVVIDKLNIRSRDKTRLVNEFVRSAGETYGKFLDATGDGRLLRIVVDKKDVRPLDPLHRTGPQTLTLFNREEIQLTDGHTLYFSAVVLPHPKQLKDRELEKLYRYTQENQGVYIFRNSRLIASGQTLGLFGKDFHLNAFRAELDYTSAADEHVLVDVAKSATMLSAEALQKVQELVTTCVKTANTLWREKDVLTEDDILGLFDESNRLIEAKAKLLAQRIDARTGRVFKPQPKASDVARLGVDAADREEVPVGGGQATKPSSAPNTAVAADAPQSVLTDTAAESGPYLNPVDELPAGLLYRPRYDPATKGVVVDVNLSHPFSKAVFSVPADDEKRRIPRKPTTAVQQLLYVLGLTEYGFDGHDDLFESFRNHASSNLRALLRD